MSFLFCLCGFIAYIYCEISLLVSIGTKIGILPMILLMAISFLGLWFVKLRGLYTIYSIRQEIAQGKMPTEALTGSALFILAGILLIIPGFLSDILAILCVLPFTRKFAENFILRFFKARISFISFGNTKSYANRDDNVFDADFERKQDSDKWIK